MQNPQESDEPHRPPPTPPVRGSDLDNATVLRAIANASPGNIGFAYTAPEHGVDPEAPVTRLGLVWRIVASVVLAAVGVNAVVQIVRMLTRADPGWVGALGMAVVAMLALAYPVVNLVRWVRVLRRPHQPPAE